MKWMCLVFVVLIGFILRIYMVNQLPALNADEAAIGYNAYSLLLTGRDEHSNFWPLEFQSFNDYKPGGYFYIVLPFVKALGLGILSVRLPNVILSTLTILVVYLLVQELFSNNELKYRGIKLQVGLFPAFLLAISPWHIHFSRGGWETSTATFFITTAVWLFIKSNKQPKLLYASVVFFALSLYTYHSARIIVPLLSLSLVIINKNKLEKLIGPGILGIVLITPILLSMIGGRASSRFSGVGIFADQGPRSRADELRGQHQDLMSFPNKIAHNKIVEYSLRFLDNYSRHYSLNFLFIEGDEIQRNKVPNVGLLYLFEIVTIPLGISFILKQRETRSIFPLVWLFIAPVAAALTFQSPHSLRAQNMSIPLSIISGVGLLALFQTFKPKVLLVGITAAVIAWNTNYYIHQYYKHMASNYPFSSQYGFKELMGYVMENSNNYEKIIITNRYDQPYILTLFYSKYDPKLFQNNHSLTPPDEYGFSTVESYDKYEFRNIVWELDSLERNALIAGTNEEIKSAGNIVKVIPFPNGDPAFKIVSN
jgi:4-amino-4-deoxy-L-arabinose transferase-like glycosyltransferase